MSITPTLIDKTGSSLEVQCCPNGPEASDENEDRTQNLMQWVRGPAASIGLRCRVHSESSFYSKLQTTRLFFILSFPRHCTDIVQISLFLPQASHFWASLRNNQQVCRQRSCLTLTQSYKVHAFMIPVILPSGSGLGVYNKIIVNKNMEDNH